MSENIRHRSFSSAHIGHLPTDATHCSCAKRLVVPVVLLAAWFATDAACAQNLMGSVNVHDPSSVLEVNGRYFLYYTGTRVTSKFSDDLIHWNQGPRVFSSPPAWTSMSVPGNTNGNFWAPDVAYFNNLYHLYYSVSTFGSQDSAIGLATSPTLDPRDPAYQWTDRGPVIESNVGSAYNAIDPSIIQSSTGEIWMAFGSFWNGIYARRIDPSTGLAMAAVRGSIVGPLHLAFNSSIEASYMYERDGFYYLFVNWGACCQGKNSTYNIRVGRSTNIIGPYLDQNGVNLINRGGTLFLGTEENFIGPGHISIFTAQGSEWFGYHYYDGNTTNGTSKYNLRAMRWTDDGWPVAGPAFPVPEPSSLLVAMTAVGVLSTARRQFWRRESGLGRRQLD